MGVSGSDKCAIQIMRNVLIVTHLTRASPRISGVAKYLPEFGWHPIILTPPSHMGHSLGRYNEKVPCRYRIIEVPYIDFVDQFSMLLKKRMGFKPNESFRRQSDILFGPETSKSAILKLALKLFKEILYYPDQDKLWKSHAIKMGNKILCSKSVDAIISSSPPVTSHIIARELKKKHKIPWIADLQDLWSQNHNYPYGTLRKAIDRKLEINTLYDASTLTTVSQPLIVILKKIHEKKPTYAIPIGFDQADMISKPMNLTSKFTITYTGQIYIGRQDVSKLLESIKELIDENSISISDIDIRFYGYKEAHLMKDIERLGLVHIAKQYGQVTRNEAIKRQKESQLLLLLNWEDLKEKGVYSLKVFEYLAAQRPILATGGFGNDVVERLLEETKAGFYAPRIEDIKEVLKQTYTEYKLKNKVIYKGVNKTINKYSHREIAKTFARILEKTIE